MTSGTVQKGPLLWVGLGVMVVFLGLCTVFALVVTVAEAWQEHRQAQWPEVTVRVDECGLVQTSSGRRGYFYIRCRLLYAVGDEEHELDIYSRNVPSREIWQYPSDQIAPFEEWVNDHPTETPMAVRYNPANHAKIALVEGNMPGSRPRTANNLKLLEFLAASFLVLLTIARITRPRTLLQNRCSSTPLGSFIRWALASAQIKKARTKRLAPSLIQLLLLAPAAGGTTVGRIATCCVRRLHRSCKAERDYCHQHNCPDLLHGFSP